MMMEYEKLSPKKTPDSMPLENLPLHAGLSLSCIGTGMSNYTSVFLLGLLLKQSGKIQQEFISILIPAFVSEVSLEHIRLCTHFIIVYDYCNAIPAELRDAQRLPNLLNCTLSSLFRESIQGPILELHT